MTIILIIVALMFGACFGFFACALLSSGKGVGWEIHDTWIEKPDMKR